MHTCTLPLLLLFPPSLTCTYVPVTGWRRVKSLGNDVPHIVKEGRVPLLELGLAAVQLGDDGLVEELFGCGWMEGSKREDVTGCQEFKERIERLQLTSLFSTLRPSLPHSLPHYLDLGMIRLRLSFFDEALKHLRGQDSGHGLEEARVGGSVGEAVLQEGLFWF